MLKLTFHGGAKTVTGASYLLDIDGYKILIDCGLRQGCNYCEKENWDPFPYDPADIKAVFVTHAHVDHTGKLPILIKDGFKGKVYSITPTKEFAHHLLLDSEHILNQDAEHFKKPPIYDDAHVAQLMKQWEGVEYHNPISLNSEKIKVTFYNAGHILGSSFILVEAGGERILFSGDLGNSPAPIIGPREAPPEDVSYCLTESTYGGRVHEKLEERKGILEDVIEDTAKLKGTLMIPSFAMERTQELLFELNNLIEHGRVPKMPVFLDSPLAIKLTNVYENYQRYFTEDVRREIQVHGSIFRFPGLRMTMETEESKAINSVSGPKVIIAGSGMSNGGRILHHEKRYLSDPKSTLLIIGYQAKGSLGRAVLEGEPTVTIYKEKIPVRCKVKAIGGYSAHADQPQLLDWLRPMRMTLKKVFIVQGEEEQAEMFKEKVVDELAIRASIPSPGEEVVL